MVYVKCNVIQVLAFKKPDIIWYLTKLGRCLNAHEIHVSFFLSMLLSVKFNYDHKDRFLVWHKNYQGKSYLSIFLLSAPFVDLLSS